MDWLWYFIVYSFMGFLLEAAFAYGTGSPNKDRKCLLLLPLCPVYGLGAVATLRLAPLGGPLWAAAAGGGVCTAVELGMGLFYRKALGVRFWDYSEAPGNLFGLICPWFSVCWAGLALVLVYVIHRPVARMVSMLPAWLGPPVFSLLAADLMVSCAALRRTGDVGVLRWYAAGPGRTLP